MRILNGSVASKAKFYLCPFFKLLNLMNTKGHAIRSLLYYRLYILSLGLH
jgi:hypothetical protein